MDMLNLIAERKTLIIAAESDQLADDERGLITDRIIKIENAVAETLPTTVPEMTAKANMVADAMEWDGCDPVYVRAMRALV
ncbi:MAG: hypothetical protein ABJN04_15615 [Hyphomicrobiales bacterium]